MMSTRVIYSSMVVWFTMVMALLVFAPYAGGHVSLARFGVALAVALMPPAMMLTVRVAAEGRR